jgi:hypothetical protein
MLYPVFVAIAFCLVGLSLSCGAVEDYTFLLANGEWFAESCEVREEDAFEVLSVLAATVRYIADILQSTVTAES